MITYLRSISLQVTVYVDDFLLAAEESCSANHINQLIHNLTALGYIINFEKSQLVASNKISYIGYTLSSDQGQVRIKEQTAHISKLKRSIRKTLQQKSITFRCLVQICGQCVSVAWVVKLGKLFLRSAHRLLGTRVCWASQVCLSTEVVCELKWWLDSVDQWIERLICSEQVQEKLSPTRVTSVGVAVYDGQVASGDWNVRVSFLLSNKRKIFAILMALKAFSSLI